MELFPLRVPAAIFRLENLELEKFHASHFQFPAAFQGIRGFPALERIPENSSRAWNSMISLDNWLRVEF